MSRFFIDHPIFASVLALVLMLAGVIEVFLLPIAQYPSIAPPEIAITAIYPGASAQTVADSVVRPILQQMSGLDGLEYISSSTQSDGSAEIDLTFIQGTDANIAQVQVQNKLSLAEATLPAEVTAEGLKVTKAAKNFMLLVALVSADRSMTSADISDYVASNMQDALTRITGVGDTTLFGSEYAMRIWLDPDKLFKFGLTVGDVTSAISAQNVQIASGELGGQPAAPGQRLDATIIGPSRLETPQAFENILLKVDQSGAQVRLKDVARIELGPESYAVTGLYNGLPASGIALKLAPGANQITTEAAVKTELGILALKLPSGLKIVYPLDTRPYIVQSITEVVKTLLMAIALVVIVIFVFLQNWRATIIPAIAVPVVLLGTFAVLAVLGYSINTLTMLAMVLAVGLLVDDAIVVVENVDRVMRERKLAPREAAQESMDDISGALVGIALALSAVFLPMAFFSGSTGVIYRQFSVTIVSAMTLSVMVALILTPALCATLLKPPEVAAAQPRKNLAARFSHGFATWFNRGFDASRKAYLASTGWMLARPLWSTLAYVLITGAAVILFTLIPTGFLPDEDQGLLFGQITLPPGATAEQTAAVDSQVVAYFQNHEKASVVSAFSVTGFSFAGRAQNQGFIVVDLKDWAQRTQASRSVAAIAARVMQHFATDRDASILILQPPPVLELGNATGFDVELEDTGELDHPAFLAARNEFLMAATQDKLLAAVHPNGLEDAPQYQLGVDREKASALGISIADVDATIEGALASDYVDQFVHNGRVKQVYVQGEVNSRMLPDDLSRWYVRNASGDLVPFDAFLTGSWTIGPQKVENYNELTSFDIQGSPAPGSSSGAAIAEVEKLVANLPAGVSYEWTGLSYEQIKSGSQTYLLYGISILVILLCLAALFGSWSVPVAVLLVVPLGLIGTILATSLRGLDNDVYFQVGLLTTMGLAAKNAILIVQFAKGFFDGGMPLAKAALQAAKERIRPILMTSIAFILGVFPLAVSSGAGAGARNAIGTAVVGGMLTATLLAIFFVPVFFTTVLGVFKVKPHQIPGHKPAEKAP